MSNPEETQEYLVACLERQFASNPPSDCNFEEDLEGDVAEYRRLTITNQPEPTSVEVVSDRHLAVRPRKTAGPDGVTNGEFAS